MGRRERRSLTKNIIAKPNKKHKEQPQVPCHHLQPILTHMVIHYYIFIHIYFIILFLQRGNKNVEFKINQLIPINKK